MSDNLHGKYSEMINASTAEEVYQKVRQWTSNLSDREHLIRAIILTIHANLEDRLKDILYRHLSSLTVHWGDQALFDERQEKLNKTIRKMSFSRVHELLKPAFDSFDSADLALLTEINKLRNDAAHAIDKDLVFRGRRLYTDHDVLAELFVTSWSIGKELNEFIEKMIDDPRDFQRIGWNVFMGRTNPLEK